MQTSGKATKLGPATGQVKWFSVDKGFGFISMDDGRECFFHKTQIRGDGKPKQGDELAFELFDGQKGLHARNISIL